MASGNGRRGRILVVDDDDDCLSALQLLLGHEGFDVEIAAGGEEALARIGECPPDVLLSDVRMPGMDGFALLRAARVGHDFPMILMSGDGMDAAAVRSVGAVEYLVKPLDFETMVRAIDRALALRKGPG